MNLTQLIDRIYKQSDYDILENYFGPNPRRIVQIPIQLEKDLTYYYQPDCHVFFRHHPDQKFPSPAGVDQIKMILYFVKVNRQVLKETSFGQYLDNLFKVYPI